MNSNELKKGDQIFFVSGSEAGQSNNGILIGQHTWKQQVFFKVALNYDDAEIFSLIDVLESRRDDTPLIHGEEIALIQASQIKCIRRKHLVFECTPTTNLMGVEVLELFTAPVEYIWSELGKGQFIAQPILPSEAKFGMEIEFRQELVNYLGSNPGEQKFWWLTELEKSPVWQDNYKQLHVSKVSARTTSDGNYIHTLKTPDKKTTYFIAVPFQAEAGCTIFLNLTQLKLVERPMEVMNEGTGQMQTVQLKWLHPNLNS